MINNMTIIHTKSETTKGTNAVLQMGLDSARGKKNVELKSIGESPRKALIIHFSESALSITNKIADLSVDYSSEEKLKVSQNTFFYDAFNVKNAEATFTNEGMSFSILEDILQHGDVLNFGPDTIFIDDLYAACPDLYNSEVNMDLAFDYFNDLSRSKGVAFVIGSRKEFTAVSEFETVAA